MEIGEKIRSIRTAKHMTQNELAGDQITRNMLSLIENGSALPSLPTVIYIAERLEVPVGLLLADEDHELIYLKMINLPKIKQAFEKGEFKLCADMCDALLGTNDAGADDEIMLLLAECHFRMAVEEFNSGRLHNSCREFDEACGYSKRSIYKGDHILSASTVYFEYMRDLSPSLDSDAGNETYEGAELCLDPFGKYVSVLRAIKNNNAALAEEYAGKASDQEKGFAEHIRAELEIMNGNYKSAREILEHLISGDLLACRAIMYDIFNSIEQCCRELGDYKSAYEYSVGKVELLEYMLKY